MVDIFFFPGLLKQLTTYCARQFFFCVLFLDLLTMDLEGNVFHFRMFCNMHWSLLKAKETVMILWIIAALMM